MIDDSRAQQDRMVLTEPACMEIRRGIGVEAKNGSGSGVSCRGQGRGRDVNLQAGCAAPLAQSSGSLILCESMQQI